MASGTAPAATQTGSSEPAGKPLSDGSHRFKFHGGPYGGCTFRVYPPFDPVVFPQNGEQPSVTYTIAPPKRGTAWVYEYIG